MKNYKVNYSDHYGKIKVWRVKARTEQEAIEAFNFFAESYHKVIFLTDIYE